MKENKAMDAINEAAEKYARNHGGENPFSGGVDQMEFEICKKRFISIATSDAARKYWYAMFVSKEIDFKIGDVFESQVNTNLDIVGSKYSIVNINYEENTIQFNNGMAISIVGLTEAVINDKYKKLKNV